MVARRSRVILSDDEVAAEVRKANEGKLVEEIAAAVEQALAERKATAEARQAEYDPVTPRDMVKVKAEPTADGVGATYTRPKE